MNSKQWVGLVVIGTCVAIAVYVLYHSWPMHPL
jgi:hypothetical protein